MSAAFPRREAPPRELRHAVHDALQRPGWRYGHLTARPLDDGALAVEALLLDTGTGGGEILTAPLPAGSTEYPSVTSLTPAAHWAERAVGDFFGVKAAGHPRWKSLILHEAWPEGLAPLRNGAGGQGASAGYAFMEVKGEGVHEIPVGPIHAGIIEPGHFRFSCLGEVITNLEIRLGYQHRGVERRLADLPGPRMRFAAEAASSDTAAGNALALAVAVEQIAGVPAPARANVLRTMALEVERVASHLGDLGGLSADIGYSAGAAVFGRLRGSALGLGELLTGHRFQRGFIAPGGVTRDLTPETRTAFAAALAALAREARQSMPLLLDNPAAQERMEGTGRLKPSLARDFGLVGPAARASGSHYDARTVFEHGIFPEGNGGTGTCNLQPATCNLQPPRSHTTPPARRDTGDVLARAQVRAEEIASSLALLERLADNLPEGELRAEVAWPLPPDRVGVGIVEAWRGELIHWITTGAGGRVTRYAIKDPSFNNWTGLAIAVRGGLVADFPLCNKSFNLSYSGNDL
jgi:Ni,Fe-hydrogenase III large subunit